MATTPSSATLVKKPVRVAVVGGGIAGLTAAWWLRQRGFEVALFDDRLHLGGRMGADPGRIPLIGDSNLYAENWPDQFADYNKLRTELLNRACLPGAQESDNGEDWAEVLRGGNVPDWLAHVVEQSLASRMMDYWHGRSWRSSGRKVVTEAARNPVSHVPAGANARGRNTGYSRVPGNAGVVAPAQAAPPTNVQPDAAAWERLGKSLSLDGAPTVGLVSSSTSRQPGTPAQPVSGNHSSLCDAIGGWRYTYDKSRDQVSNISFCAALHRRFDGRIVLDINDGVRHEHCYHMYLNWYRNFWTLMKEIGIDRHTHFDPHDQYVHLFPGNQPIVKRTAKLINLGSHESWAENMLSGAASPADFFLGLYSVLDLVSQPLDPSLYLDRKSVHAFLSSRSYASEAAMRLHEVLLLRAFAVPTFLSSAFAYQKYLSFTIADPTPALWVYKKNADEMFRQFRERLESPPSNDQTQLGIKACHMFLGQRVTRFGRSSETGLIRDIIFRPSDLRWPRGRDDGERRTDLGGPEQESTFCPEYVILAVPPKALAGIVSDFRDEVPGLSRVRKLQSGISAVLDLYLHHHIEGIPRDHVVLRGSRYGLTFFDNSQLWQDGPEISEDTRKATGGKSGPKRTVLNVSVADFHKIDGMDKVEAMREIVADLMRFIPFKEEDIDFSRTYLQMNENEPLFLNEVGGEPWRPATRTEIPNLFLAGDSVANEIEEVCVEGAVVSGIQAARAVQAQLRVDREDIPPDSILFQEVELTMPKELPRGQAEALKLMLSGFLPPARMASRAHELAEHPARALSPRDFESMANGASAWPAEIASTLSGLEKSTFEWMTTLPLDGPPFR